MKKRISLVLLMLTFLIMILNLDFGDDVFNWELNGTTYLFLGLTVILLIISLLKKH